MTRLIVLGAVLLAAGCRSEPDPQLVQQPSDSCGAAGLQTLVGRDAGALAAMTFAQETTRFINDGDAVTQDFRPERLNIVFGPDQRIARVYCG